MNQQSIETIHSNLKICLEDLKQKMFNEKVFTTYVKCLLKEKTLTAIKISEKYKKQIEDIPDSQKDFLFRYYYNLLNKLLK